MTTPKEIATSFDCQGEVLFAVTHHPHPLSTTGVVIVVGGPQTKHGAHRQFVIIARSLASAGYPTLRFDVRGMGDSTGNIRSFEALDDDIKSAVAYHRAQYPNLKRIVLLGLCDGASAAMLASACCDGLILINPWVHIPGSDIHNRALVRTHYQQQLLSLAFWRRFFSGEVKIIASLKEAIKRIQSLLKPSAPTPKQALNFIDRMHQAWYSFTGPSLLLLSDQDQTAAEFAALLNTSPWQAFASAATLTRIELSEANHTFSTMPARTQVITACIDWLTKLK